MATGGPASDPASAVTATAMAARAATGAAMAMGEGMAAATAVGEATVAVMAGVTATDMGMEAEEASKSPYQVGRIECARIGDMVGAAP